MSYLIRNLRALAACVAVVALLAIALAFHRLPAASNVGNLFPLMQWVICAGAAGLITYLALWPTRSRMSQEAQLLRAVTDGVTELVFVKDVRGKYLYMNRAGVEMLRKAPSEIIGHRNEELFPPDVARALDAACQPVIATGQPSHAEHDVPTACGTRTFSSTKVPHRNRKGELIGVMGIAHDITDRKQIEAQLRRSHEQLTDVLECMTDGMYTCDREWRFTFINARARELLGLSDADMGQVLWQVRPETVGSIFDQQFGRVMKERINVVFEAQYDARDWEVHAYPTTEGVVVYFQNITERKVAQDRLAESELRFRQLAENIREVFWMSDAHKSEILYVSPGYADTWGRSPEDLGTNPMAFMESVHPDDRAKVLEWVKNQSTVDSSEIEYRIIRPDGSMRWIRDRSFSVKDAAGNVIRHAGIAEDITARKIAEGASGHLAAIVHSCEHAIISETLDGVITSWNKAAERLYGFTPGEAIGRNVSMLVPPEALEDMQQNLQRVASGERVEQFEARRVRKDGSSLEVSISISPIHDSAGKIVGISKIARDITVRRRAEALERERAALKESIGAMEQVLGVVGHELRTPLAGLRAMSEFLLTDGAGATAEFDRFLRGINEEAIRMAETVDNLLEAARLNSGKAKWNFQRLRIRDVCEHALDLIRPLVDPAAIALGSDVPQDLQLYGDADALRRLIINLAGNSCKHTKSGRIDVTATGRSDDCGDWIELRISDTGSGIPPEILSRLGEAFALNSGVVGANHVSGTGLGIAICNAIVAAHGGYLKVESKVGEGTVIIATLRADLTKPQPLPSPSSPPMPLRCAT